MSSDTRCDAIRADLVDLDREELAPSRAAELRSHLAACSACAGEARRIARAVAAVSAATRLEPSQESTSRLLRAVDAELGARRADRTAAVRRSGFRVLRDAWVDARAHYEQSASVRRFTFASLVVHAAAAAFLAFVLTQPGRDGEREVVVTAQVDPAEIRPTSERTAALAPFDPATDDGFESPGGRRFPNAATARRVGVLFDRDARSARLRDAVGADAPEVERVLGACLEELVARQAPDGSFDGAGATTARAVLAFARSGRQAADDPAYLRAVAWLDGATAGRDGDVAATAASLEARAAYFAAEFDRLGASERRSRRTGLARSARELTASMAGDTERLDVDATLAAARALGAVRDVGALDTGDALVEAAARLDRARTTEGRLPGRDRVETVTRTAEFAALARGAGGERLSDALASRLAAQIEELAPLHPDVAAAGIRALRAHELPVGTTVRGVLRVPSAGATTEAVVGRALALTRPLVD